MHVLRHLNGVHAVLARLLYGTGMRTTVALHLRVKDIDFAHNAIIIRSGRGDKDRLVMLPAGLDEALREQLRLANPIWRTDRDDALPGVELPNALAPKYPRGSQSWPWFWVFCSHCWATAMYRLR